MADVSFRVEPPNQLKVLNDLAHVLEEIAGVTTVQLDPTALQIAVSYNPKKVDTFTLVTAVQEAGYSVIMQTKTILVEGMTCAACAFHVESALTDVPGVVEAEVNLQTGETAVTSVREAVNMDLLHDAVAEAGYSVKQLTQI